MPPAPPSLRHVIYGLTGYYLGATALDQGSCVQSDGDVYTSLWSRDMGSHSARPQKIACLPDEVSDVRHYWSDLVEQEKK